MKIQKLKLSELEGNIGQIPELPMNPRNWNKDEVDALAASLKETPELFEARPIIVVPYGEKYVILGGNMRFEASKQNEAKDVPCIVFPADTPIAKMKEIVIKDNGSFGTWDLAALKSEWGDLPLPDWGAPKLPSIDISGLFSGEEPKPSAGAAKEQELTIVFPASVDIEDARARIILALEGIEHEIK